MVDVVRAAPESLLHSSLDSSEEKSLRSAGCSSAGGGVREELGMVKEDVGLDAKKETERDGLFGAGMGMGGSAWTVFSYLKPTRPRSSLKGISDDEVRRLEYRRLGNFGGDIVRMEFCLSAGPRAALFVSNWRVGILGPVLALRAALTDPVGTREISAGCTAGHGMLGRPCCLSVTAQGNAGTCREGRQGFVTPGRGSGRQSDISSSP